MTPVERTDLYDDFDIHHDILSDKIIANELILANNENL